MGRLRWGSALVSRSRSDLWLLDQIARHGGTWSDGELQLGAGGDGAPSWLRAYTPGPSVTGRAGWLVAAGLARTVTATASVDDATVQVTTRGRLAPARWRLHRRHRGRTCHTVGLDRAGAIDELEHIYARIGQSINDEVEALNPASGAAARALVDERLARFGLVGATADAARAAAVLVTLDA